MEKTPLTKLVLVERKHEVSLTTIDQNDFHSVSFTKAPQDVMERVKEQEANYSEEFEIDGIKCVATKQITGIYEEVMVHPTAVLTPDEFGDLVNQFPSRIISTVKNADRDGSVIELDQGAFGKGIFFVGKDLEHDKRIVELLI